NGALIRKNLDAIKSYLLRKTNSIEITDKVEEKLQDYFNYQSEPFVKYRQSPFKSFNNYILGLIIIGLLYWMADFKSILQWQGLFLVFCIGIILLLAFIQNHYFILSTNYLVVKNLVLPGW